MNESMRLKSWQRAWTSFQPPTDQILHILLLVLDRDFKSSFFQDDRDEKNQLLKAEPRTEYFALAMVSLRCHAITQLI